MQDDPPFEIDDDTEAGAKATDHNDLGTVRIRALNDALRTELRGNGQILVTQGIQALGEVALIEIMGKVQTFDQFGEDNDPYGEHDFGSFDHQGQTIYWKIDYFDLTLTGGSPDAADPDVTKRVLTILLASEY